MRSVCLVCLGLCVLVLGACSESEAPLVPTVDSQATGTRAEDTGLSSPEGLDSGQDSVTQDAGPTALGPPSKGETRWLEQDDGQGVGFLQYESAPDHYVEFVRFEISAPARIWGLRAQLQVPLEGTVTLYIWDDWGGNHLSFDEAKPLAVLHRDLAPSESQVWVDFELEEAVDLVPGRMFYAGLIVEHEASAQLWVDATQPSVEGKAVHSLVWMSNEPPDEQGFPSYQGASGDFLLRVEVEDLLTLGPGEKAFEALELNEVGLVAGGRMAVADVDRDGDDDLMIAGPRLFLNDGGGLFTEVSDTWLVGLSGHNGGVFGDYDNDGDPDYLATGHEPSERLLRNEGDRFVDVTADSGIDDSQDFTCGETTGVQAVPTEAAVWLDVDGDGWLDLYQANFICWDPPAVASRDRLWRNQGDGTFVEHTEAFGLGQAPALAGRGLAPADANGDGWVDMLVTNYRLHRNLFLLNDGGKSFLRRGTASTLAGVKTLAQGGNYYGHSIGAAWGDVDEDGDLDVFVANLAHPRFYDFSDKATLYINDGQADPVFSNANALIGLRYLETPSNPNLWDMDNDGDLDLFFTCIYEHRVSQLYRNDGHPAWQELGWASGIEAFNGWGSVTLDFDRDGDLDLIAGGKLFRNRNPEGHAAVMVKLEGAGAGATNRDAIGARVLGRLGERRLMRERVGGHGTGVQESPWLHFGLGQASAIDLEVYFPRVTSPITVSQVPAGAWITVHEDGTVSGL